MWPRCLVAYGCRSISVLGLPQSRDTAMTTVLVAPLAPRKVATDAYLTPQRLPTSPKSRTKVVVCPACSHPHKTSFEYLHDKFYSCPGCHVVVLVSWDSD